MQNALCWYPSSHRKTRRSQKSLPDVAYDQLNHDMVGLDSYAWQTRTDHRFYGVVSEFSFSILLGPQTPQYGYRHHETFIILDAVPKAVPRF